MALALVFPMAVGLIHAMHEHDRLACMAKNESHIHRKNLDCDHEHYFIPGGTFDYSDPTSNLVFEYFAPDTFGNTSGKSSTLIANLSLRGPPSINV